jgi:thiol-disulfide isomerase/thioredoxin
MGKASRTKIESSRREKIAAQRAAERRAEQRRRILIASGAIVVVLAIVVAFVVVKLNSKPSSPSASSSSSGPTGAALTSVINDVTSVPASTLDKVGSGQFTGKIQAIKPAGAPLTANGKPEMLYMGAEYCPYCAAARWAMIVALRERQHRAGVQRLDGEEQASRCDKDTEAREDQCIAPTDSAAFDHRGGQRGNRNNRSGLACQIQWSIT